MSGSRQAGKRGPRCHHRYIWAWHGTGRQSVGPQVEPVCCPKAKAKPAGETKPQRHTNRHKAAHMEVVEGKGENENVCECIIFINV